jgi:hypothetical protein
LNLNTLGSPQPPESQSDFYDAAPLEPHLLYQGEILIDVPLLVMPKDSRWQLLRTRSGRRFEDALEHGNLGGKVEVLDSNRSAIEWYANPDGDWAAGRLSKRPVLVLSQTCDVQTKDYIQVAPIYPVPREDLERVKNGALYSVFYLQPHAPEFGDSFADLEKMQAVHKSYIRRPILHFRLTDYRVRELQRFLTRYFGRPNSFDADVDAVPRTGSYLCVDCFYFDGKVASISRAQGEEFGECPGCNGTKWVIQARPRPTRRTRLISFVKSAFRRPKSSTNDSGTIR